MSLLWVLQHMERRCYLDSSLCIKCLFLLTLACTLEDAVYQTACRKSSSNSESPRLQYICKPRYLKITHRSMIGKIAVKTRHQQSSAKETEWPLMCFYKKACEGTGRREIQPICKTTTPPRLLHQFEMTYLILFRNLQLYYTQFKNPLKQPASVNHNMHFSINQWHHTRIQDIWFENKEDFHKRKHHNT